jgi:hypothetical protein
MGMLEAMATLLSFLPYSSSPNGKFTGERSETGETTCWHS